MLIKTQSITLPTELDSYDEDGNKIPGVRVPFVVGDQFLKMVKDEYKGDAYKGSRGIRAWLTDNGVRLEDIYRAFGYTPNELLRTQVRQVVANDNLRPFFAPTTEEGFRLGIQSVADKFEPLIGNTVDVDGLVTEWYEIQNTTEAKDTTENYTLRTIGQGAEIPVSTIVVGQKQVGLTKKGRGIAWTDEALAMPVSLIQMFLQVLGIRIGQSYYRMVADRLLNGYFDDNSDDPTTTPADVTSTYTSGHIKPADFKATYGDFLRAKDVLEETNGYPATDMMAHPNTLINMRTMLWGTTGATTPVFENGDIGKNLGLEVHRSTALAEEYIIFFNRAAALVRYVFKPFGTEDDRIVSQQVNATYASMTDQVVIGIPESRVVLDLVWP